MVVTEDYSHGQFWEEGAFVKFSTILLSSGCHPLDSVTRGDPPPFPASLCPSDATEYETYEYNQNIG